MAIEVSVRAMETSCRAWCDMDCPWDGTGTTVVTLRGEENVWRKGRRMCGEGRRMCGERGEKKKSKWKGKGEEV